MILTIKTDQPQAEIALYSDNSMLKEISWQAHRELSDTFFLKLKELLEAGETDYTGLSGIVVFRGPGSFTGLRIGATVANTLAQALSIPVVGSMGDDWAESGRIRLKNGENDTIVLPEYGRDARITTPRK